MEVVFDIYFSKTYLFYQVSILFVYISILYENLTNILSKVLFNLILREKERNNKVALLLYYEPSFDAVLSKKFDILSMSIRSEFFFIFLLFKMRDHHNHLKYGHLF